MTKKKRPSGKKAQAEKVVSAVNVQKNEALPGIDPEQWCCMIAEAAYHREATGFSRRSSIG